MERFGSGTKKSLIGQFKPEVTSRNQLVILDTTLGNNLILMGMEPGLKQENIMPNVDRARRVCVCVLTAGQSV